MYLFDYQLLFCFIYCIFKGILSRICPVSGDLKT
nr:MAG TPA: hypothetical protein [Caudoviricetes sp.]